MNWGLTFTGDSVVDILLISLSVFLMCVVVYRLVSLWWSNPRLEWERQHKADQLVLETLDLQTEILLSERKVRVKASVQRGQPNMGGSFLASKKMDLPLEDCLSGDFPEHDLSRFIMVDWAKIRRDLQDGHLFLDDFPVEIPQRDDDGEELSLSQRLETMSLILENKFPEWEWKQTRTTQNQFDKDRILRCLSNVSADVADIKNKVGGVTTQVAQSHNALYMLSQSIREAVTGIPTDQIQKILTLLDTLDHKVTAMGASPAPTTKAQDSGNAPDLDSILEKAEAVDSAVKLQDLWQTVPDASKSWDDAVAELPNHNPTRQQIGTSGRDYPKAKNAVGAFQDGVFASSAALRSSMPKFLEKYREQIKGVSYLEGVDLVIQFLTGEITSRKKDYEINHEELAKGLPFLDGKLKIVSVLEEDWKRFQELEKEVVSLLETTPTAKCICGRSQATDEILATLTRIETVLGVMRESDIIIDTTSLKVYIKDQLEQAGTRTKGHVLSASTAVLDKLDALPDQITSAIPEDELAQVIERINNVVDDVKDHVSSEAYASQQFLRKEFMDVTQAASDMIRSDLREKIAKELQQLREEKALASARNATQQDLEELREALTTLRTNFERGLGQIESKLQEGVDQYKEGDYQRIAEILSFVYSRLEDETPLGVYLARYPYLSDKVKSLIDSVSDGKIR